MSRPKEFEGRRVQTVVRLDPELHERLRAAAAEREIAANWLVTRAIEDFLDRLMAVGRVLYAPSSPLEVGSCPDP